MSISNSSVFTQFTYFTVKQLFCLKLAHQRTCLVYDVKNFIYCSHAVVQAINSQQYLVIIVNNFKSNSDNILEL